MKAVGLMAVMAIMAEGLCAQPVITEVLDGAALTANIAQGSVFVVKGTGLASLGVIQATAPSYPTTLNNVGISFTSLGGVTTSALMVYTYNKDGVIQLAAVVRSNMAVGAYDLKVTNGTSTSAAFRMNVVARKPGIVTASSDGQGIAQATLQGQAILQRTSAQGKIGDFDTRPAHPNDIMTLWGTGLGADLSSDTGGSSGDQTTAGVIRVVLNGLDIVPSYAGRSSGYPGLDQVNFTIPANVSLQCENTVQIRTTGGMSNVVSIATSAANATSCSNPNSGGTGACPARVNSGIGNSTPSQAEINEWIASGQECQGAFSISRTISYVGDYTKAGNPFTISKKDTSAASFSRITGSDLGPSLNNTTPPPGYQIPAPGVCNILPLNQVDPYPNLFYNYLDAGNPLTVRGANGSKDLPRSTNSVGNIGYNVTTGTGVAGNWMDPGAYTFSGPGSSIIGTFSYNITVPTEFIVTNANALQTTPVTRSAGLTVTWTGGDPTTLVYISGSSYVNGASGLTGNGFQCYENNTTGHFTVPVSILQQLPSTTPYVVSGVTITLAGNIGVSSIAKPVRGYATGIDYLASTSSYNYSFNPLYQ